jgi:hypothetical protein
LRDFDRLQPIAGLCDDLDLRVDLEQLPEPGPNKGLVIGDGDADAQERTVSSGRRAFTA